jgi:hypothetical protein
MKKRLNFKKGEIENIIKEEEAFTMKKTKSVQKDTGKFNDDYYKDVTKKFEDYNEPLKATEKENSDAVMKYTNSEDNQEYHDEYEILNGLEMTIYGNDPDEKFKDRAEKAIAGDSTMGNANVDADGTPLGNVVTADQAGFTGPEFGKNLIDRIKSRQEKSDDEAEKWNGMGDVPLPLGKAKKPNRSISENKKQVKMKRLRFKKPFTGVENALKLIPESYKVDNKTFQMTDGNEKYEIRWEGNITEGSAIILKASDKVLMNEDMQKMKHLMQYNSKDTLGNLRGKERINENKVFNDVWNKTKSIKESSAFGFGFTNEGNLEENEEIDEDIMDFWLTNAVVDDAGLGYMKSEDPDGLKFDVAFAMAAFAHDYNDNHPLIHQIRKMLNDDDFKPNRSFSYSRDGLEEVGKQIYDELVNGEEFYRGVAEDKEFEKL